VVTITPGAGSLDVGQPYKLYILPPKNAGDPNGLRTIDGATLAADSPSVLSFTAAAATTPTVQTPTIQFCRDVAPVISDMDRCAGCHLAPSPFAGLALDTIADIQHTAIDLVAHGSNTGPFAMTPAPAGLFTRDEFTQDVPIIDPGPNGGGTAAFAGPPAADGAVPLPNTTGDPGHSWIIYKVLMAPPPACDPSPNANYPPCDGGALPANAAPVPASIAHLYEVACSDAGDPCPQPLPDDERARLASLITGLAMPYPLPAPVGALTVAEQELLSLWIAQGAPMPPTCATSAGDGGAGDGGSGDGGTSDGGDASP
jgi:hypothetical protein